MTFSALDKLACAERELRLRMRVYKRLIAEGKMPDRQAEREINIMAEIARDYRAQVEAEQPKLELK